MTDHKASRGLEMSEQGRAGLPLVTAYGQGGFVIGNRRIDGALLLMPDHAHALEAASMADLSPAMLDPLFKADPSIDVLLVGTGEKMIPMPANLREMLQSHSFVPDLMDSGACARTFNILLLEDRRVAALLFPV